MIFNVDIATNTLIKDVDDSKWNKVSEEQRTITYTYHLDRPVETRLDVIKEYPNGGKDYEEKIITPEQGHFEVTYDDGNTFPYPINIPDNISKENPIPDIIDVIYWKEFTPEELNEKEEAAKLQEEEAAKNQEKFEAQQAFLENGPSQLNDIQTAQDDMTLLLADIVGGAV